MNIPLSSKKFPDSCTNDPFITQFSSIQDSYISKIFDLTSSFKEIIVDPFNRFTSSYEKFCNDYNSEFVNISSKVKEIKKSTNEALKLYKIYLNKSQNLGENIDENKKNQLKLEKNISEEKYKNELNKETQLLPIFNKKYFEINHSFFEFEESRVAFMKDTINKTTKYIKDKINIDNNFLDNITKLSNDLNKETYINNLKNQLNKYLLFGERFRIDDFKNSSGIQINTNVNLDYLNKLKNSETTTNNKKNLKNNDSNTENDVNKFTKNFLELLFSENEIDINLVAKLMDYIYKDKSKNNSYINNFFKFFISSQKSDFYIFHNINNLQILSNIINTIKNISKNFDIDSMIIYIAEKTYCKNNNEKIYLSAILGQNKLYKQKTHWMDLIEYKLIRKLEEHKVHLESMEKSKKSGIISGLFGMSNIIKNTFETTNNKLILESSSLCEKIPGYKKLSTENKNILNEFATEEIENVLKEYIVHLCNFNLKQETIIDVIILISTKFSLTKDKINYFVNNSNIWINSIKRKLPEDIHDELTKRKIYEIKNNKNIIVNKYNNPNIKMLNIVVFSSQFLPLNEIPKILSLSKNIQEKGKIKIYKQFLNNINLSINQRISIWKNILLVSHLYLQHDYNKIKQENLFSKNSPEISNQILMDINRTTFKDSTDEENNKKKLNDILNIIAYLIPDLNYCQGMSYIASFLFQLTKFNEEDTFYLMLAIVKNTEYKSIFASDLKKLKNFFYSFDRLIAIYIPEVYQILKIHNLQVNYFCTSWFITLFTNSCLLVDVENPPKILLKIWDGYFLKGWKALLSTGLIVLKSNEDKLWKMDNNELVKFLIEDIFNSEIFNDKCFQLYLELNKKFYVKNRIMKNLETEYVYKKNQKKSSEQI